MTSPVPNAFGALASTAPAETSMPPENVLTVGVMSPPDVMNGWNASVPAPVFFTDPLPENTPVYTSVSPVATLIVSSCPSDRSKSFGM